MLKCVRATLAASSLAWCGFALAWGPTGHMMIGAIADQLLAGTNAGTQVRKILGSSLRTASVWADCAKGVSPETLEYGGDGIFPECAMYENGASKARMVDFVRRNLTNCNSQPGAEICHKQYHYTDVAIQRAEYVKGRVGTSDHDVVSALAATIEVLQGRPSPPPFDIRSKREALRLLSHYVGDIHQPLHVAAIYLDAQGNAVDPDQQSFDPRTGTRGGNDLLIGAIKLHAQWDGVSGWVSGTEVHRAALDRARAVRLTPGPLSVWPAAWASETLSAGKLAFAGLQFSPADLANHHKVVLPPDYGSLKARIQEKQIITAGARLAQVLRAVWP